MRRRYRRLLTMLASQLVIRMMLSLPSSQKKITSELAKTKQQLRLKLAPSVYPSGVTITTVKSIPDQGRDKAWLAEEFRNLKLLEKNDVGEGRVSGTVYHVRLPPKPECS